MTIVIADDLTGAAELAGIGFRYGLTTALVLEKVMPHDIELLVVCTDSRSLPGEEAIRVTADTINWVMTLQPQLLYKKIDSVLRGHVLPELKTQMNLSGQHSALVIPANPSLGRTIRGGHYYINDEPVNTTSFATDPEFAIRDSSVLAMMNSRADDVQVLTTADDLPGKGILIGEAVSPADIEKWVTKVKGDIILAGAGDFFTALLDSRYKEKQQLRLLPNRPHLYISGTAFQRSIEFIKETDQKTGCVAYLPASDNEAWVKNASDIINTQNRLIIAFDGTQLNENMPAFSLRRIMTAAVGRVVKKEDIKELFIEGGSTAAEILRELSITTLSPVDEWQRGVVRMKAGDKYITVKPGSYELPPTIKTIYNQET